MAIIQSGASTALWTIDSTSTAGRATLYDINGNAMCDVSSLNNVLNALNAAVTFTLGGQTTVGFNVASTSGTLTLIFEATIDNTNWFSIPASPIAGGATVTSTSANGQWVASTGGYYAVRARISAFTSGSMTVSLVVTPGSSTLAALTVSGTVTANIGTTNGLALDTSVNGILVSQGSTTSGEKGPLIQGAVTTGSPSYTTAQTSPLSLTTAGALRIDGSAVTQPVSGTVTANAGTGTFTVSGTVTSNIGTTNGLALDATVSGLQVSQGSTTSGEKGTLIQGAVTTASPSYTTAQTSPLSLTTAGALRIDGSAVTQPVSGTVTANAGTGTFTVGGTVTANIGTTNGLALDTSVNGILVSQGSTTSGEKGPLIQGAVTTSSPTYTTAQTSPLSLTTAGALRIDGSAVTQPVSGTVTANAGTGTFTVGGTVTSNQGTANTLANAWPTEITDGTHGPAAVKAASTAAVATDPSLVVALSPNTPTPPAFDNTGTGTISALNGTVTWGTQGMSGQGIQITGTWSATLTFQFSVDGGTTWWNDEVQSAQGSSGIIQSTTANGMWFSTGLGGYRQYRVIATAYTSGTATITWNAGVGNNALSTVTNIVDGVGNGPAAVTVASTAPVASQQSLVVGVSPNSIAAADRSTITAGSKQLAIIGGMDGVGGIARAARIGEFGTQRVTSEVLLWHDALEGTTVNAFWTQSATTMTIAQTTGVLTLNNSGITTLNTDAIITSQRQFPKYPRNPLYCRYRANVSANVASNHTLAEFGLGAPSGVTATINNGAFFRWTSAGNLNAVVSFNGTEQSTQVLAQGTISTTEYYFYDIIADDDFVRYIVSDSSGVPVVDTQITITNTVANLMAVSHIPSFARVYVDTTGGGTVVKLNISAHSVQVLDGALETTWQEQMGYMMRHASINPTTYAQTAQLAAGAAPATITPNNTGSTSYTTLGGEYAVALTVASENLLGVFAFTIPTPYTFVLRGLTFTIPVVTTAISVTGVPYIEWAVVANCASANISTGNGQRFTTGAAFSYTSITQAAGVVCTNAGNLMWTPQSPIICLPGTVLNIVYKVLVTSAAGTPGVTRGSVVVDGNFV